MFETLLMCASKGREHYALDRFEIQDKPQRFVVTFQARRGAVNIICIALEARIWYICCKQNYKS